VEVLAEVKPYDAYLGRHNHPDIFSSLDERAIKNYGERVLQLLNEYKDTDSQTQEIVLQTATRLGFAAFNQQENLGDIRGRGGKALVVALYSRGDFEKKLEDKHQLFIYARYGICICSSH
jgi:hypothetical protein